MGTVQGRVLTLEGVPAVGDLVILPAALIFNESRSQPPHAGLAAVLTLDGDGKFQGEVTDEVLRDCLVTESWSSRAYPLHLRPQGPVASLPTLDLCQLAPPYGWDAGYFLLPYNGGLGSTGGAPLDGDNVWTGTNEFDNAITVAAGNTVSFLAAHGAHVDVHGNEQTLLVDGGLAIPEGSAYLCMGDDPIGYGAAEGDPVIWRGGSFPLFTLLQVEGGAQTADILYGATEQGMIQTVYDALLAMGFIAP